MTRKTKKTLTLLLMSVASVLIPLAGCLAWNLYWQGPRHGDVGLVGGIIIMLVGMQAGMLMVQHYRYRL